MFSREFLKDFSQFLLAKCVHVAIHYHDVAINNVVWLGMCPNSGIAATTTSSVNMCSTYTADMLMCSLVFSGPL